MVRATVLQKESQVLALPYLYIMQQFRQWLVFECGVFFLIGEGPRSRSYGRTAALRLIVQPYDDDDDDYYFLSFS
jgi:hypothetical protein